jgi:outer membrane receptor protein involved in Fe transport
MSETKRRTNIRLRRSLLWLALLQATVAWAQGEAGAPATAAEPGTGDAEQPSQAAEQAAPGEAAAPRRARGKQSKEDANQLETITVTAQKKVENIQKVPIAITAFGGEELSDRKIETGGDLVTATPNVSFSKTNFAMYNFQIRGIGTQALSVTTDPAVAVSFNSSPMIRNRLFEQEYFDVDRVEVLRGPQGTLYGRNATAGVVNMIPNLPSFEGFESWIKAELGNYDSRRFSGMVNVPLGETLAFRAAGAWTDRSGYDYNTVTKEDVNGRELWSGRLSLAWKPAEGINANIVWEHFDEDDNRSRTGKQLCHTDPGPTSVGDFIIDKERDRGLLSQGCRDGSLYGNGAFGVPNGAGLPWITAAGGSAGEYGYRPIPDPFGFPFSANTVIPLNLDPFAGVTQSHDLRKIATPYDPIFKAKNDVVQINFDAELNDHLKFVSQTLYTRDRYYSSQDYGRFASVPIFTDDSQGVYTLNPDGSDLGPPVHPLTPGGVFCDPQLGCSDRMLMVDLNKAYSTQWSQEFRLQSSFDGAFNFNLGANYLHYKIDESYYVFNNVFTLLTQTYFRRGGAGNAGSVEPPPFCPPGDPDGCVYVDPNPLDRINGQGHNYFRSWNVAETKSAALFGEGYWQLSDELKLTVGLRYTDDKKTTTPYPSQLLLAPTLTGGGYVNSGYPALPDIEQKWGEWTGRVVLDWAPQLSFTDSTLIYTSFSRGYKAGGTNSPPIGADPQYLYFPTRDQRYKPEYVNAFELGMKNVMAEGRLIFNATVFYNDYKNYQISQIQDRATLNENFDAKTWGLELETVWKPTPAFQLSGNLGLLGTRLAGNQYSLDVMDRTAGNPDWIVVRPWLQNSSNCIAPRALVDQFFQNWYSFGGLPSTGFELTRFCGPSPFTSGPFVGEYGFNYDPRVDAPNGGAGFKKNVGGHSLPNAPHITVSVSPQYTFFTSHGDLILRADLYYQGESWARIYQDKIDRLHDWGNVNLSLTWQKLESDFTMQLYVKNALGGEAITGTFLNSDDTGLTTNVFIQDPRIFGLSVRKGFY